jgi:hypothetical protein
MKQPAQCPTSYLKISKRDQLHHHHGVVQRIVY